MADLEAFFRDYADSYNQALGDSPDYERIRDYFTDCFIAAGPDGVRCGNNDDGFVRMLEQGYAFYKAVGTQRMNFERVEAIPIDDGHCMARVHYRAEYRRSSGEETSIDFDLTYFVRTMGEEIRIFGFVAGDEMGAYRQAGLVDAEGKPLG